MPKNFPIQKSFGDLVCCYLLGQRSQTYVRHRTCILEHLDSHDWMLRYFQTVLYILVLQWNRPGMDLVDYNRPEEKHLFSVLVWSNVVQLRQCLLLHIDGLHNLFNILCINITAHILVSICNRKVMYLFIYIILFTEKWWMFQEFLISDAGLATSFTVQHWIIVQLFGLFKIFCCTCH